MTAAGATRVLGDGGTGDEKVRTEVPTCARTSLSIYSAAHASVSENCDFGFRQNLRGEGEAPSPF